MEVFGLNLWKDTLSALALALGKVQHIGHEQFVVTEAELREFVSFTNLCLYTHFNAISTNGDATVINLSFQLSVLYWMGDKEEQNKHAS